MESRPVAVASKRPSRIGTFAILFACIGLLDVAFTASSIGELRYDPDLDGAVVWMYVWVAASIALFGLQLVGGVLARRYRPAAIGVLTIYGLAAILLIVGDLVVMNTWHRRPGLSWELTSGLRRIVDVLALPWPILVTVLVHSQGTKAAFETGLPRRLPAARIVHRS
jgi:hypothetical protein